MGNGAFARGYCLMAGLVALGYGGYQAGSSEQHFRITVYAATGDQATIVLPMLRAVT